MSAHLNRADNSAEKSAAWVFIILEFVTFSAEIRMIRPYCFFAFEILSSGLSLCLLHQHLLLPLN